MTDIDTAMMWILEYYEGDGDHCGQCEHQRFEFEGSAVAQQWCGVFEEHTTPAKCPALPDEIY